MKESKESPSLTMMNLSSQKIKSKGSKKTLIMEDSSQNKLKLRHCTTSIGQSLIHLSPTPLLSANISYKPMKTIDNGDENEETPNPQDLLTQVNILPTGASFGELALLSHNPRAATIICREECDFAVLEKEDFKKILKSSEEKKLLEEMNFFQSLSIFKNWNFNLVKMLYVNTQTRVCGLHEIVYEENQESEEMFIVQKGTFIVQKSLKLQNFYNLKKWGGMRDLFSNDSKFQNKEMIKVTKFIEIFIFH